MRSTQRFTVADDSRRKRGPSRDTPFIDEGYGTDFSNPVTCVNVTERLVIRFYRLRSAFYPLSTFEKPRRAFMMPQPQPQPQENGETSNTQQKIEIPCSNNAPIV